MVSIFENKNNQKKDIIIITGVSIDKTPVIKSFINYYSNKNKNLVTIEYIHKKRLSFIFKTLSLISKYNYSKFIFIGIQTLPIIFLAQIFLNKYFYWELESYYSNNSKSFVLKMLYFKKFINWTKVYLILPDLMRWNKNDDRKIKNKLIVPNVPLSGKPFIKRSLNDRDKIKLIFYGNLDNDYVYVNEWIEFAKKESGIFITLIGRNFDLKVFETLPKNVEYKPEVSHNELLSFLNKYHFSIIGYRPVDFNHKYCVPNKLFEAFSFSMPVIANSKNPTLVKIISDTNAGKLISFEDNIEYQLNINEIRMNYETYSLNSFKSYKNKYYFEYFAKTQLDNFIL